jgi:SNF family Na+-dependent transporter
MPWSGCNNEWNTPDCLDQFTDNTKEQNDFILNSNSSNAINNIIIKNNRTNASRSPAEEYFNRYMLGIHKSTGIDDLGPIKLDLTFCLALVYLLMYICICKGVKGTGKAVYVTAVLPYIILIVLLIHGLTLKGSLQGVIYFLTPSFQKLSDFECWKDAAIQIFFTLGPGISVLTTYASYSKFTNNCQIDAISASIANVIASFLSGIVVFASLGHLSYHAGKPINEVTRQDVGLSFIAYPEILATFKYSGFYSVIFFLMIINLGLDSGFGGLEAIYTALADEFRIIKKYRKTSMALIHFVLFLGSLPTVTYGGMYLVSYLDTFSTSPALMLIVFFEAISVSWIYGMRKFSDNTNSMFKIRPNKFFRLCWKYIGPAIILALFFISILLFEQPEVDGYRYPFGFLVSGWMINISIMLPIPIYAVYRCFFSSLQTNAK